MSDEQAVVETPVEEAAAPIDIAAPEPEPEPQAAELDADNLDATLEAQAIQIPDGDKLVPLSAVLTARDKLKTAKTEAAKVPVLEQQKQALEQQLAQIAPAAEALRALQAAAAAQPQQRQQPTGPTPEQVAEAEAFAKDFDLYTPEGKPDLQRAARIIARNNQTTARVAQDIASRYVAPLANRTIANDVAHNFERAKITEVNGTRADPAILKNYFDRMATTADGLRQLANPESVAIITKQAIFDTWAQGKAQPAQAATTTTTTKREPLPEPVFTERAGGQDSPQIALSSMEKRLAREMYPKLTEAQAVSAYTKSAAAMPWRKSRE